jgi:hypothetical protein
MSKIIEQWLLFEYVGRELTPLSKPFKTREQAEKAREKYPERLRKRIGVGVIRIKTYETVSCQEVVWRTGGLSRRVQFPERYKEAKQKYERGNYVGCPFPSLCFEPVRHDENRATNSSRPYWLWRRPIRPMRNR